MVDVLNSPFRFLFLDFEHYTYITLTQKVKGHIEGLLAHIKSTYGRSRVNRLTSSAAKQRTQIISQLSIVNVVNSVSKFLHGGNKSMQDELGERFAALGYDNDTLANSILAVLVGASVELSQGEFGSLDRVVIDD